MELERANKELLRSNANLEEFAHVASHDLKEPIRKIHFFTDQLKSQLSQRLNEYEKQTFNRIENASQRMGALIDDLLLYSHVSTKSHATEEVDLNEKIKKVLEDLELEIQQKGARIHVGKLPVIRGYRSQL
jgi:light-regulated signal transduction histidine kinase (bacteriophytochrome)